MKAFLVYWHNEPKSFNGAMFEMAQSALTSAGHEVRVSDLCAMRFDATSDRRNFVTVKDASFLKQQQEELAGLGAAGRIWTVLSEASHG